MAEAELENGDITPQALDILASLASLGISEALRVRVQDAIAELHQATHPSEPPVSITATHGKSTGGPPHGSKGEVGGGGSPAAPRHVADLEHKLHLSRSIMRKLYHKNQNLEKELQIAKANQLAPPASGSPDASRAASGAGASVSYPDLAPGTAGSNQSKLLLQALQERDSTISQLQAALESSRRRAALMESAAPPRSHAAAAALPNSLADVVAQSSLHLSKYRQIREDYNRLLSKRASSLQTPRTVAANTRAIVGGLQQRLVAEIQEREAEAALYSARLYEQERQLSDWYVEKRIMEEQVSSLREEIKERDRIDREIENCVCSVFERMRLLEANNEELRSKIEELGAGGVPDGKSKPPDILTLG